MVYISVQMLHMLQIAIWASEAEIVETTFRSRFRFRFLKYPLFKKVVSFRVPEI